MRYLIKFSYDGSNYSGFQKQKGLKSIQEELEHALTIINNSKPTKLVAAGRTDKGVHALCQCAHADLDVNITEYKLKRALNSNLPDDIHVIKTQIVSSDFHARYNVENKTYEYYINLGEYNPIQKNYVFQYNYALDVSNMEKALKYLEGTNDFRAFVTEGSSKTNCIRTIEETKIEKVEDNLIKIVFKGTGFLRYQVRNMVGILIKVGENKIEPIEVKKILDSKDRTKTGKTAPPEGLYLVDIEYQNI